MQMTQEQLMKEWERRARVGAEAFEIAFGYKRLAPYVPLEKFFPSPLAITPCESGAIRITHRVETGSTPIIGARQALMSGRKQVNLKLDRPLIIHELGDENHGTWMTDLPEELHQIAQMIETVKPSGRVLVGGLGLGLVVHYLARRKSVKHITVVERNADVIKLVQPHLPKKPEIRVINDDITHFLTETKEAFHYYLLDTWQGTSESTWWGKVMPMKRLIRNRFGELPVIHCWAEDIMAGQILPVLGGATRYWKHKNLPLMDAKECAFFFTNCGTVEWEERYGKCIIEEEDED